MTKETQTTKLGLDDPRSQNHIGFIVPGLDVPFEMRIDWNYSQDDTILNAWSISMVAFTLFLWSPYCWRQARDTQSVLPKLYPDPKRSIELIKTPEFPFMRPRPLRPFLVCRSDLGESLLNWLTSIYSWLGSRVRKVFQLRQIYEFYLNNLTILLSQNVTQE